MFSAISLRANGSLIQQLRLVVTWAILALPTFPEFVCDWLVTMLLLYECLINVQWPSRQIGSLDAAVEVGGHISNSFLFQRKTWQGNLLALPHIAWICLQLISHHTTALWMVKKYSVPSCWGQIGSLDTAVEVGGTRPILSLRSCTPKIRLRSA